jgi:hypothetical protein
MRKLDVLSTLNHYIKCKNYFVKMLLVDCGYDNEVEVFCAENEIGYIKLNEKYFNKSKAINVGLYFLNKAGIHRDAYILICDSDVLIPKQVLDTFSENLGVNIILNEVVESETNTTRLAYGIIASKLSNFILVNGYDSNFKGWGFEDHDIINRIEQLSHSFSRMGFGYHLSHPDIDRVKNYHSSDLILMRKINLDYYESKKQNGLLIGTLEKDVSAYKTY